MGALNKIRVVVNPSELLLIMRITAVLLVLPVSLKFMNIHRIVQTLTPVRTRKPPEGLPPERISYLCLRVLGLFGRLSYRTNCLRRCLLLFHCLRYYGSAVVIHFGVKPGGEDLLGHCWLTVDGVLYQDSADMVRRFTHMFSLPSGEPAAGAPSGLRDEGPDLRTISFDA